MTPFARTSQLAERAFWLGPQSNSTPSTPASHHVTGADDRRPDHSELPSDGSVGAVVRANGSFER